MPRLAVGDTAPDFTLPTADGGTVTLSDLRGEHVVVYFYPAAMTPGCTIQAVDFTASQQEFNKAGYDIVGISPDSVDKLAKFRDKEALGVTLLGDPSKDAQSSFVNLGSMRGALRDAYACCCSTMTGRFVTPSATFVPAPKGSSPPPPPAGTRL